MQPSIYSRHNIVTSAIVEKLVLEKERAQHEALEAFIQRVAGLVQAHPGRARQPIQQASGDLSEIYNQAAALKAHFEEVRGWLCDRVYVCLWAAEWLSERVDGRVRRWVCVVG